jgi:hypothetical protein
VADSGILPSTSFALRLVYLFGNEDLQEEAAAAELPHLCFTDVAPFLPIGIRCAPRMTRAFLHSDGVDRR